MSLSRIFLMLVGFSALTLATEARGWDEPVPGPSTKLKLFDGKSLEGWKRVESTRAGIVAIEDGAIVLESGGPMTLLVSTRVDLPRIDYEIAFEAKRTVGNDFFAAATFPVGKSHITLVNGGWGGSVTGLSSLNGSDASENDSRRFVKYENDKWYRFRVRVTDEVIRCWVDDREIFAVDHRDQEVKTRIETRSCQPLGFASYRSRGLIRSVEVRGLSTAEVAENNKLPQG